MNFRIVGMGELLWDLFPGGKQLGGAPANFAFHAASLGADSRVISRVGQDALGKELLDRLVSLGLSVDCIEIDPSAPTGTVSVSVDAAGQPTFVIHEGVAWDNLAGDEPGRRAVMQADAVCFGSLAQRGERARRTIQSLLASSKPEALRVFDINLRQDFFSPEIISESLAFANVLKVNDAELPRLAGMFSLRGDARAQIEQLARNKSLRLVACTRGAHGSLLFAGERWSEHPGIATRVVDTVGAGDSFAAAMTVGFLAGWDLDEINRRANEVAAFVAGSVGGTPPLPESLRSRFVAVNPPSTI